MCHNKSKRMGSENLGSLGGKLGASAEEHPMPELSTRRALNKPRARSERGLRSRRFVPLGFGTLVFVVVTSCSTRDLSPGDVTAPLMTTPHHSGSGSSTEGMVLLPGGTFEMGINEDQLSDLVAMGRDVPHMDKSLARSWFGDEIPRHTVELDPFYIDVHEVTNGKFSVFAHATGYEAEGDWREHANHERTNHPVVNVTWNDAKAYAEWAGKRLPTEAEWEYAAKGGQDVRWFPWGDEPDRTRANYRYQGETFWEGIPRLLGLRPINTKAVGSYAANGYGLHDVCGNVSEWCGATYEPYPGACEDLDRYSNHPGCGPPSCQAEPFVGKVVRGGSWESPNAVFVRITGRSAFEEDDSSYCRGFRCVKSL